MIASVEHTPTTLRRAAGYGQDELARKISMKPSTLSRLEQGCSVRLDTVRRYAAALGLTTADVVQAMDHVRAQRKAAGQG